MRYTVILAPPDDIEDDIGFPALLREVNAQTPNAAVLQAKRRCAFQYGVEDPEDFLFLYVFHGFPAQAAYSYDDPAQAAYSYDEEEDNS